MLILGALLVISPFFFMIITSFKSFNELAGGNKLWPRHWTAEAYKVLFAIAKSDGNPIWRYFLNSLWTTLCLALVQMFFSAMGGFALYYYNTWVGKVVMWILTALMAIPFESLLLGRFIFNSNLGWQNTPFALIWPFVGNVFTIYQFRSTFYRIGANTKKAALADGMNSNEFFWTIALPAILPSIITSFILCFITSWNSTLWPVLILQPNSKWATIPVLLYKINTIDPITLVNSYGKVAHIDQVVSTVNLKMATTTLSIAPIFVLFIGLNRQLMKGILKEWKK